MPLGRPAWGKAAVAARSVAPGQAEDEMTRTISTETPPPATSTFNTPTPDSNAPQRRNSAPMLVRVGIVVALVLAGYLIWSNFVAPPKIPRSVVALSGRIEGDDSAVAPKTAGRILEIRFREGDPVKAGDTIAVLDDAQVFAREDQARAAVTVSEARLKSARDQVAVFQEQLQQNNLQTEQSKVDASGRVRQAEADVAAAESDLASQEAAFQIADFDRTAYNKLRKTDAVSERQARQANATAEQQAAAVAAARRKLESARGMLTMAQASLSNPGIRGFQASTVRKQLAQQRSEIAYAQALAEQARFQLAEAVATRSDLTVKAPFDGTVMTRAAEPGEVVQAGTAIVTLLDLSKVYLRGFIPEGLIGKVKVGQAARIYLDSDPAKSIDAYVERIDPQATFTPENTYFRDDRVKQVVGVKLRLKGGIGFAKPGMPADGEVLVEGSKWPAGRFNR
jgi:HlyD family secretion protein